MFAPLSSIAPLAGLPSPQRLAASGCIPGTRERMSRIEWLATLLIVSGVTLVALAGPGHGEDEQEVVTSGLPAAFSQPPFLAYAAFSAAAVASWLVLIEQRCSKRLRQRYRPREDSMQAALGSAMTSAMTSGFSIIFLKVLALGMREWAGGNRRRR